MIVAREPREADDTRRVFPRRLDARAVTSIARYDLSAARELRQFD